MSYRRMGIAIALLACAGLWCAQAREKPLSVATDNKASKETASDDHGAYLANEVAHCNHCHTPPNSKGQPDKARLMQGATLPFRPKEKIKGWADKSPDITRAGLAGKWSEEDMVKFLMTGMNPDGEMPTPPMPVFHLHQNDAQAVAHYLRSLRGKKAD